MIYFFYWIFINTFEQQTKTHKMKTKIWNGKVISIRQTSTDFFGNTLYEVSFRNGKKAFYERNSKREMRISVDSIIYFDGYFVGQHFMITEVFDVQEVQLFIKNEQEKELYYHFKSEREKELCHMLRN